MKIPLLASVFGFVLISADDFSILKDLSNRNMNFISMLYKELSRKYPKNFLVCPLSIQIVFAMLKVGAKGNTAKEITASLYLPDTEKKAKDIFKLLSESLKSSNAFRTTNRIYVADGTKISARYKSLTAGIYHSDIKSINFAKRKSAVSKIYTWVKNKVGKQIKTLLSEDLIKQETVLMLVSAAYFRETWVNSFSLFEEKLPFYIDAEKTTNIEMMMLEGYFKCIQYPALEASFLELPYTGGEVSMVIILPEHLGGLSDLEAVIEGVLISSNLLSNDDRKFVTIQIPKFKMSTTLQVNPILRNMGIIDAFLKDADFSGISGNKKPLKIDQVLQKTLIDVNENGTTDKVNLNARDRFGVYFLANHPFIYYLKHKVYGIFLIGRFTVPATEE